MGRVIHLTAADGREIKVAEIKGKYISNIIDAASKCEYIDRVILFGSSTMEVCSESSDIDLAVFGNQPKGRCLSSRAFRRFSDQLASFDNFMQAYDILYFQTGKKYAGRIMEEIAGGEVLYVREIASPGGEAEAIEEAEKAEKTASDS